MQEVLKYLRANGYKTYIVTGGGQDFVRVYSEQVYGIPPEQVVGTARRHDLRLRQGRQAVPDQGAEAAAQRRQGRQARGHPSDDRAPARSRPSATPTGDQQMLEYTQGRRRRAAVDAGAARRRASANTPTARRRGCPTPRSAPSPRRCTTRRRSRAGSVISMKNDWKRIFAFE
ncbi:MAG: HAD family hydrolase [Comamonadaceae bacterium]|nr:HAD family hydrolase [Comamonadaceae bacterium]